MKSLPILVALGLVAATASQAATVTYGEPELSSALTVTVDGLTLTSSTSDGDIATLDNGFFAGLYIGINDDFGTYELSFSEEIDSISIEFDALSNINGLQTEAIFGFATSDGSVSVGYTDQVGTAFDGTTITSTTNDGQGIITFASADPFTSFFFSHSQDPLQNGFVIENVIVNTLGGVSPVPLPASGLLLAGALFGLALRRRRRDLAS